MAENGLLTILEKALLGIAEISPPVASLTAPLEYPDGTGAQFVAVRQGYDAHRLRPPPRLARTHIFDDLVGFADWLIRHATAPEKAEILVGTERVVALVDGSDARTDRVVCCLRKHPTAEAWEEALDDPLSQKAFIAFARGFAHSIVSGGEDLVANLGVLQVAAGDRFESRLDETGASRFQGFEKDRQISGKIPARFVVECPIFDGVQVLPGDPVVLGGEASYRFDVFVSLDVEGGTVLFELDAPAYSQVLVEARRDAAQFLASLLVGTPEEARAFQVGLGLISAAVELDVQKVSDDLIDD